MIIKIVKNNLCVENLKLESLEVFLDGTTLLIVSGYKAFAMCAALDVPIYNSKKMKDRNVLCAKAMNVKSIDELLAANVYECCDKLKELGITNQNKIIDVFKLLAKK